MGELRHERLESVTVRGESYRLLVAPEQGGDGFSVQCRELPGAIEQGDTLAEAIANGTAAIESILDFLDRRDLAQRSGDG